MLKTEPSLSSYCESGDGLKPENPVTGIEERRVGDSVDAGFSFAKHNTDVLFIKEEDSQTEQGDDEVAIKKIDGGRGFEIERPPSPSLHLAAGSGIDEFDLYGKEIKFDLPSFDDESCGDYYKRMLDNYPLHPLLLKNYASFLEYKGDLSGAGEYYHKCTVVEPSDGVALTSYGRLVMQLHQDEAKASNYFERAVQASPEDSNVLGAYASFLWEIDAEDDDDEDGDSFECSRMQNIKEDKIVLLLAMEMIPFLLIEMIALRLIH